MQYDVLDIELSKLYDIGKQIIDKYKEQLELDNINASGSLSNSIEWNIVKKDENTLTLEMSLFDYWIYTEYGRQPTSAQSTKWDDSVGDIKKWIINKIKKGKFIPRPDKQIPTTDKQIEQTAYAIVNKIHKYGYYEYNQSGKHPLQTSLQKSANEGLIDKFCNAVGGELANEIVVELNKLSVRPKPKPKRPKNI